MLISKNPDGLSPFLILFWFCGDGLNFIGGILADQTITQNITSAYYLIMDFTSTTEWCILKIYNKYKKKKKEKIEGKKKKRVSINVNVDEEEKKPLIFEKKESGELLFGIIINFGIIFSIIFGIYSIFRKFLFREDEINYYNSRILLENKQKPEWEIIIGYCMGCVYACLTTAARIPQIILNFKRKSTEGLSLYMFFFTLGGNLTYNLSLLLYSIDAIEGMGYFLLKKLPWMVGVTGGFLTDLVIMSQFILYSYYKRKKKKREKVENLVRDKDGNEVLY